MQTLKVIYSTDKKNIGREISQADLVVGKELMLDDDYKMEIHGVLSFDGYTKVYNANYQIILI